ncbi:MAG TPA: RND transporter [Desulfocapsa sulfexigens]|nr:RND transporter [Desulfocapsa sulfexigens]
MTNKKKRIDSMFAALTKIIIRFRFPIVLIVILLSAALASQIRYLTIDTSNEGLLHPDDDILLAYNDFRDQFGRDDLLVFAVQSDDIFSLPFLEKLKKFHDKLEEKVPHVTEINSLINARNTKGVGDTLLVDDLLAKFPKNDQELAALKELVLSNPSYINMLVSEDATFTTVLLQSDTYTSAGSETGDSTTGIDDELAGFGDESAGFEDDSNAEKPEYLTDKENAAMVRAGMEIAKEFNGPDFRISTAGSPAVTHTVKKLMMADMKRFLRLAVLTIGISLFFMFRRISGVVLPLFVVALTLVSTLGLMAKMGIFFKTPTIILPSFLLAVGVGASIHVLSLVYQYLRRDSNQNEAIVHAYEHSGFAIVMTSLTTAAGLASFASAEVAPIADLGLFSAIGVMLSLFFTLILLPALLAIIPLKKIKSEIEKNKVTVFDRLIDWVTVFTTSNPKLVVAVGAIGVAVALTGLPRLQFSHNLLSWLPEDLPVRTATETIDHNLRGSVALEVVLDTGKENGLYDKDVLNAINKLAGELEQFKQGDLFVGKVIAVSNILKEIHQALNENRPEMYAIPENGALIPQEFLLFENSGSDDLEDFVDSRFQLARVTIKVPWRDSLAYVPFIKEIEQRFATAFADLDEAGKSVQVSTTGIMSLFARILHATMYSAAQSYGIALVVISIMMILLIGHLRLGLIAMIPNLGPILMVMGIMGWLAIPLDMFTMMVASIAIGLAVDDTVHFIYNFKRYYLETGNVQEAVGHTLHTAGRAMLTTSIVLSIGFFIFMFASMNNVFNFGALVGMSIVLALIGDFFVAPALMALCADRMLKKEA